MFTNGLTIALELEAAFPRVTVVVTGGTLRPMQHSLVNPLGESILATGSTRRSRSSAATASTRPAGSPTSTCPRPRSSGAWSPPPGAGSCWPTARKVGVGRAGAGVRHRGRRRADHRRPRRRRPCSTRIRDARRRGHRRRRRPTSGDRERSRVAVVGAGPAGLTAAYRLRAARPRRRRARTRAGRRRADPHRAPRRRPLGRHRRRVAGQLLPATRSPCSTRSASATCCRRCSCAAAATCCLDGAVVPDAELGRAGSSSTTLLGPVDKARFFAYMARLFATQRGDLRDRPGARRRDGASTSCAPMGDAARDRIVRPNFEGPFFARLEEMSGALVRSWLRCLSVGTFFHVDGGMDAPWRHLADRARRAAPASTSTAVSRAPGGGRRGARPTRVDERYDGAVVAVPAPVAATLVDRADRPAWLDDVRYVPHVRLYAARRGRRPGAQRHPRVPQRPGRHRRARRRPLRGVGPGARRLGSGRSCAPRPRRAPPLLDADPEEVAASACGRRRAGSTRACSRSSAPTSCS